MATGNNDSYCCYGLDVLSCNNPEPDADVNNRANPPTNPLRVKCDFGSRGQKLPPVMRIIHMVLVFMFRILRSCCNVIIHRRTANSRPINASNAPSELTFILLWHDVTTVNDLYICSEAYGPQIQLSHVRSNIPCIQYRQCHYRHINFSKAEHLSMYSEQQKAICGTYKTCIHLTDAVLMYHILSYANFVYLQSIGTRIFHETLMATTTTHDYRRSLINLPPTNNTTRIRGTGSWGLYNCPHVKSVDVMNNVLGEKHAGNVNRLTCNEHSIQVYGGCRTSINASNANHFVRRNNMDLYSTYLVYTKITSVEAKHNFMHPSSPRHFGTCRAQTRLFAEINRSDNPTAEPIVVICAIFRLTLFSKIQKLPLIYERFHTTILDHQWFYVYQYIICQTEYSVLYAEVGYKGIKSYDLYLASVGLLKMYVPTPTKAVHE